ncbi:type II and III secretion system protein family protein [Vibrio sp. TRT 17S01]|uniref:type II and III secretion system protein family protein n=1 Tax=Vibrio sp. TRT 17S01 TaxID=3418505 RepID=UPI003CFA0DBD
MLSFRVGKAMRFTLTGLLLSLITLIVPLQANAAEVSTTRNALTLVIGKAKKITIDRRVHTVFISDPDIASFQAPTSNTLLIFGREVGMTSLFVLDKDGNDIYSASITVAYDLSHLTPMLKREFPTSNIRVRAHGQGVMLTGTVPDAVTAAQAVQLTNEHLKRVLGDKAKKEASDSSSEEKNGIGAGEGSGGFKLELVTNRLSISTPTQVNIRVRIAEVSKQVKENFGFQWNYAADTVKSALDNLTFGLSRDVIWKPGNPIVGDIGDAVGMVDILAEENMVTVLAEPNLTATSGETASFLAGGEVPQVIGGGENEAPTIEYRQFGVLLAVTPTILSGNRIALKVKTEISDLSAANSVYTAGVVQSGFDIRRAETSVELGSGQSFALAGLVKRNVSDELQHLPWINQIPVLGRLFESSKFKNNETELVIIASAYLVEPAATPLALPTDEVHLASPFERLIFGRTLKPIENYQRPPAAIASEVFQGFEF